MTRVLSFIMAMSVLGIHCKKIDEKLIIEYKSIECENIKYTKKPKVIIIYFYDVLLKRFSQTKFSGQEYDYYKKIDTIDFIVFVKSKRYYVKPEIYRKVFVGMRIDRKHLRKSPDKDQVIKIEESEYLENISIKI
jgi:hypothetical protein